MLRALPATTTACRERVRASLAQAPRATTAGAGGDRAAVVPALRAALTGRVSTAPLPPYFARQGGLS